MGLMMELVSETDEQTMVLGEATVRTRCLAMFATPMRERAAKNKVEFKVKLSMPVLAGFKSYAYPSTIRKLNEEKQTCFFGMLI